MAQHLLCPLFLRVSCACMSASSQARPAPLELRMIGLWLTLHLVMEPNAASLGSERAPTRFPAGFAPRQHVLASL